MPKLKLKKKRGIWVLDKRNTIKTLERAMAALGYEMQISTRPLKDKKAD